MTKRARTDKRQTKPDTGIAKVDAPMSDGRTVSFPIKEEIRDLLNARPHPTDQAYKERIEAFKRQQEAEQRDVDASQYTTAELEANRYSGYRVNHLAGKFEIWCLGHVAASERISRVMKNPGIIADLHEKAFSTNGTVVELDLPTQQEGIPDVNIQGGRKIN